MPSTEELVIAARRGDKSAFAELVRLYERGAVITSYAVVRDYHAAQDIAQEAFLCAFSSLGQLRDAAAFGPWLLQIVRRRALVARQVPRHGPIPLDFPEPASGSTADWIKPYEEVVEQLARLSEKDRALVILRHIDGRSVQEIAVTTGQPVETVRKQLYRAVQRLRNHLTEVLT
jgi:RNA polymerase sigma-70 factor (ECF subfamily)